MAESLKLTIRGRLVWEGIKKVSNNGEIPLIYLPKVLNNLIGRKVYVKVYVLEDEMA